MLTIPRTKSTVSFRHLPCRGGSDTGWNRSSRSSAELSANPSDASANFRKQAVYERDLETGYYEKGSCVDDVEHDSGFVVFDLFGGFDRRPGKVMRRPIKFSPVQTSTIRAAKLKATTGGSIRTS